MLCKNLEPTELPMFISAVGSTGNWIANEKFDGDRIRMRIKDSKCNLFNRRGIDVTEVYPEFHGNIFPAHLDVLLDGEMCVLDSDGLSQFNEGIAFRTHCKTSESIFNAMNEYPVTFITFDVVMTNVPLKTRLYELKHIVDEIKAHNEHECKIEMAKTWTDIKACWTDATSRKGEGIVIKDLNSFYHENKRTASWRKVKDIKEVDLKFVQFEEHNMGITVTSSKGIRVVVNGFQSQEVKSEIQKHGEVMGTIRHMGETNAGKYRQPTWAKLVM